MAQRSVGAGRAAPQAAVGHGAADGACRTAADRLSRYSDVAPGAGSSLARARAGGSRERPATPTDNRRIAGGVAAGERPRSPERRALVGGVPPPRIAVPDAAAGAAPADPERRHLPDDPVRLVHRRITVAARPVGAAAGGVL